jgi:lipopolysaccharide/colanic/teichoic acid biosynthesis glycosyltransferase
MLKRSFDIAISSLALIVFSPVLVVIASIIRCKDGSPVLYRGLRVGRFGQTFRVLKFRTMVADAERLGGSATSDSDSRITPIGKLLRKHKLDELPQLINVWKGDMSLVGPRPEVPAYIALMSVAEKTVLTVRPGITDWATLWDADEGALLAHFDDPEKAYEELVLPEKIKLQLRYVRNHSFLVDLVILWKTLHAVIFKPVPGSFALLAQTREMGQSEPVSASAAGSEVR